MRTQPALGRLRLASGSAIFAGALCLAVPLLPAANAFAGQTSGLAIPRFVSLKAARVNMRVGPGNEYQVEWLYLRRGLPVEIIQEYDNWRKVRDAQGNEGWILHSLLSGSRTVIVAPWSGRRGLIEMRAEPSPGAALVARIEPGAIAGVTVCANSWCVLEAEGAKGYVRQNQLWGVYPDENLKD